MGAARACLHMASPSATPRVATLTKRGPLRQLPDAGSSSVLNPVPTRSNRRSWLPALLSTPDSHSRIPAEIRADPGEITECEFERAIAPPASLLAWLLENPHELTWPTTRGGAPRPFNQATRSARRRLIDLADAPEGQQAKRDGLAALAANGAAGSRRKWWAFEGFTHVDVFIATPRIVVLVEGKRTDMLSPATDWYPRRSQLARNLEAAAAVADGRIGVVMLALEHLIPDLDVDSHRDGLRHLDADDQDRMLSGFVGQASWKQICDATGVDYAALPDEVAE
jgi:hypothetical protein